MYTSPTAAIAKREADFSGLDIELLRPMAGIRKRENKNRRRFTDKQIRSLESMFQSESRPELLVKQQLANDVGLEPRQIAIWFQNKRARSKSKQIEQDYSMLKNSYDTLASRFDSLKKENQCLLIQLQRLRNLMGKPPESKNCELEQPGKSNDAEYEITDTNCEAEEKPNLLLESYNHEIGILLCDDNSANMEYFGQDTDIQNIAEPPEGSLTSSGNWCSFESSFESSCLLDHSNCSSQWWDI